MSSTDKIRRYSNQNKEMKKILETGKTVNGDDISDNLRFEIDKMIVRNKREIELLMGL